MGDTNKRRKGKGTGGRDRQRLHMQKLRQNPDKYDMSKRQQKKKWRTSQVASRARKQEERERMEQATMNTPPDSPEDAAPAAAPIENAHGSLQKERGRKKIRRDRSRLSRRA